MYIKDGVCCKRRADLEQANLECTWLEIRPFLIGNIYQPPNSTVRWNETSKKILKMCKERKKKYI